MSAERIVSRSKARILGWKPWNFDAEPGDIMVDESEGIAYRLEVSRNKFHRSQGEPCFRKLKKPGYRATIEDGKLVWVREEVNS